MTFEEIGAMNMKQAQILLDEWQAEKARRIELAKSFADKTSGKAFPVIDILKGVYYG